MMRELHSKMPGKGPWIVMCELSSKRVATAEKTMANAGLHSGLRSCLLRFFSASQKGGIRACLASWFDDSGDLVKGLTE
jgi:hypothetical protein